MQKLGIMKPLANSCAALGIRNPTPVQVACIPKILAGENVVGAAPTGSGKTAAFALPILQKLSVDPYGIFALILTPTRELALQIKDQFVAIGRPIGVRCAVIVGGEQSVDQALKLAKHPHIVVCTPGRLVAHLSTNRNDLFLKRLKFLVLDEADRLLAPGFEAALATILQELPPAEQRQTLYFSATMTATLDRMTQLAKKTPFCFDQSPNQPLAVVRDVEQFYAFMPERVKICSLVYAVRRELERDAASQVIVFAQTCRRAQQLTLALLELRLPATPLHSRLTQRDRVASLTAFRGAKARILCATDVAARGLDIAGVGLVVHFDAPREPSDYVHRTGRTARAGRRGVALALIAPHDVDLIRNVEEATSTTLVEWDAADDDVLYHLKESLAAWRVAGVKLEHSEFDERDKKRKLLNKLERDSNIQASSNIDDDNNNNNNNNNDDDGPTSRTDNNNNNNNNDDDNDAVTNRNTAKRRKLVKKN